MDPVRPDRADAVLDSRGVAENGEKVARLDAVGHSEVDDHRGIRADRDDAVAGEDDPAAGLARRGVARHGRGGLARQRDRDRLEGLQKGAHRNVRTGARDPKNRSAPLNAVENPAAPILVEEAHVLAGHGMHDRLLGGDDPELVPDFEPPVVTRIEVEEVARGVVGLLGQVLRPDHGGRERLARRTHVPETVEVALVSERLGRLHDADSSRLLNGLRLRRDDHRSPGNLADPRRGRWSRRGLSDAGRGHQKSAGEDEKTTGETHGDSLRNSEGHDFCLKSTPGPANCQRSGLRKAGVTAGISSATWAGGWRSPCSGRPAFLRGRSWPCGRTRFRGTRR